MKIPQTLPVNVAENFHLKSVAAVQELKHHDMIYIYHQLATGSTVQLFADGTNIKGDIRYRVMYRHFTLGYVTLGGYFKSFYEEHPELKATIVSMQKEKFLPVKAIDIEVDIISLKNVS